MPRTKTPQAPLCPAFPDHGRMVLRPLPQTDEQAWCGTWWDCTRCASSTLDPSPVLRAYLDQFVPVDAG